MGLDIRVYKNKEEIDVWLHKSVGSDFWQLVLNNPHESYDCDHIKVSAVTLKKLLSISRKDYPFEINYSNFIDVRKGIRTILKSCDKNTELILEYNM